MVDFYTIQLPQPTKGIDRDLVAVDRRSPRTHHAILERFALYFKREFHFDFPQFEAGELQVDFRAWIFAAEPDSGWRAFGAACFRPNEDPACTQTRWSLDWIWLHPYFRGRGHLKEAWPIFTGALGGCVFVQPPYSSAMESFLRSVEPNTLAKPLRDAIASGKKLRRIGES